MKIAKLHNNKILKFPDITPDEVIDSVVRSHLKPSLDKIVQKEKKEDETKKISDARHHEIIEILNNVSIKLEKLIKISEYNIKISLAKRRSIPIRDANGKLIAADSEIQL